VTNLINLLLPVFAREEEVLVIAAHKVDWLNSYVLFVLSQL
jgi:hypothetical protein